MATYTCCTGQTECNRIVTIGYLKSFIGTDIKNADGATVYVSTTKLDSYEPTYSELTGGTLIPKFVDGGSGKWHSNVDGITVKGTYASNQNVKQEDLVLTYTRFNSVSVSASKTSFNECSDSTSVCATYTLKKTIKQMNSSCIVTSSTENGSDTTCKMSFSKSGDWLTLGSCSNNCVTASAGKNGSWSANSRSCTVTASLTYKGSSHSDSVTITQHALEGSFDNNYGSSYNNYVGKYYTATEITSHSNITQNTCSGATVTASTTATYYSRYRWIDSCGLPYDSTTPGFVTYDDRYGTEAGPSSSYTFAKVVCPTSAKTDSHTMTITYQGHSDSITFYQACSQACTTCDDVNTYGSCTYNNCADERNWVSECGGNVTVSCSMPTTIHHKTWINGECVETGTTTTAYTQSAIVTIPKNTTQSAKTYNSSVITLEGGTINYTICQKAGPCGGCGEAHTTYAYADVNVNCSAHTNENISVPYTSTTTYDVTACSAETAIGSSAYTIVNIPCNNTSNVVDYPQNGFTIHQAAGPCCCSCSDLTLGAAPSVWDYNQTNVKTVTVNSGSCISMSVSNTSHFNVSLGNGVINVSPKGNNESSSAYTDTVTVVYTANGGSCTSKTFTVTQNPHTCPVDSCTCYTVSNTGIVETLTCESSAATLTWNYQEHRVTTGSNCSVTSQVISSGSSSANVTFASNASGTTSVTRNGTYTWTSHNKCGDNKCTSTPITISYTITLPPCDCDCDDITLTKDY